MLDSPEGSQVDAAVDDVITRLIARGTSVATAESCTGGLVGALLTRRPGSSRSYRGGAIVYANEEKTRQLGVPAEAIARHGAVSEEVVRAMATGARERFGVELAVAISGVAGPDGGTPEKPVGTVWLAVASPRGVTAKQISVPGGRDEVRARSAAAAIAMLGEAVPA